ncbi:hypothetical protein N9E57_00680 [Gammaproteobacteria bacterium]|nr:hypothetical protein [Gammaproteobacteria bacterium]
MTRKKQSTKGIRQSSIKIRGRILKRRSILNYGLGIGAGASLAALTPRSLIPTVFAAEQRPRFQRIPVQYIAALASPEASSGNNAQQWGIWRKDPGPRGVPLDYYETLKANDNIAPAQWTFDAQGWWLEENGLIMEPPEFPLAEGHYLVTGSREKSAMLTVHPLQSDGSQPWSLDNDTTVYDVTHLRCRSAIYTPKTGEDSCSPKLANADDFPVRPGADMPIVDGCNKLDYMVLIVYAIAEEGI